MPLTDSQNALRSPLRKNSEIMTYMTLIRFLFLSGLLRDTHISNRYIKTVFFACFWPVLKMRSKSRAPRAHFSRWQTE